MRTYSTDNMCMCCMCRMLISQASNVVGRKAHLSCAHVR